MMKSSILIISALLVLTPISGAIDFAPNKEDEKNEADLDIQRSWDYKHNEEELPWWERTSMDKNRNGISDVLDPYAELQLKDHIDVDLTISYSRDITTEDMKILSERGIQASYVIDLIDSVIIHRLPSYRIYEILQMEDVIFIEPLGIPLLHSDIATPTVRAKQSEMYSPQTAWDLGYTGKGVSLAVIDTGTDDEHPSLSGKFLGGVDMTKPDNLPFLYPQDGSFNPDDIQGHGSTCAGIAIGTGGNEGKYQGTAPGARLVDVRIGTQIGYAPGEFWVGAVSDPHIKDGTLRGISWATEMSDSQWQNGGDEYRGIDIFSISWGIDIGMDSDGTDQYSRLLDAAVERGVIVVNAAGNDGPSNTGFNGLSASSEAIIVGATDDNDTLGHEDDVIAFYSSVGPRTDDGDNNPFDELKPDVSAPGTHIMNMQPDTQRITGDASSNGYGNRGSGTSYATPLVAGVIALMLEANPELEGENNLVKEILKYTAEKKNPAYYPELDPFWEPEFGYGVVDAYNAVRLSRTVNSAEDFNPDLQAHITNVSGIGEIKPFYTYNTSSPFELRGLGWARMGDYQKTEYRVDDGDWEPIEDQIEGPFNPWVVKLNLDRGQYRISVRSVGSGGSSLYSFIDLDILESETGQREGIGGASLTWMIIGMIALAGAAVYLFYRHRKK
jgi:subtilisin family serine protease